MRFASPEKQQQKPPPPLQARLPKQPVLAICSVDSAGLPPFPGFALHCLWSASPPGAHEQAALGLCGAAVPSGVGALVLRLQDGGGAWSRRYQHCSEAGPGPVTLQACPLHFMTTFCQLQVPSREGGASVGHGSRVTLRRARPESDGGRFKSPPVSVSVSAATGLNGPCGWLCTLLASLNLGFPCQGFSFVL